MTRSAPDTAARLATFAEQYGFSEDAVRHLFEAVTEGGGDMAMFDHPEFHGPGQWMRGGLMMTTAPDDRVLNNAIETLCNRLSELLREQPLQEQPGRRRISPSARAWDTSAAPRDQWWPSEWGTPIATGQAGDLAYAFFADAARLGVRLGDHVALYNTADQHITGISQARQGTTEGLVFTTPFRELPLEELERCESDTAATADDAIAGEMDTDASYLPRQTTTQSSTEILQTIERLGALHREGMLTDEEFSSKKQELLKRL